MLYMPGCEPSGTSHGSDRATLNARLNSSAMPGTSMLFTSLKPGLVPKLPMITTS